MADLTNNPPVLNLKNGHVQDTKLIYQNNTNSGVSYKVRDLVRYKVLGSFLRPKVLWSLLGLKQGSAQLASSESKIAI